MLFGLVQTPDDLARCPQLEASGFYREVDHPVMGRLKVPAVLFNLSLTPYQLRHSAPLLGRTTRRSTVIAWVTQRKTWYACANLT